MASDYLEKSKGGSEEDDDDGEGVFHPTLVDNPRRFVDFMSKEAQEFNDILDSHLSREVIKWDCTEELGWNFEFNDLVLEVQHSVLDPVKVVVTSSTMHRMYLDSLRRNLRRILSTPLDSRHDMLGFAMILLRLVEEAVTIIAYWKTTRMTPATHQNTDPNKPWDVKEVDIQKAILDNPFGLDLSTIDESGDQLLGTPIKKICENIPSEYRILHVEPVFREDLVTKFQTQQHKIFEDLIKLPYYQLRRCISHKAIPSGSALDNQHDLAVELSKPTTTFHGTQHHAVSSIVRWGFIKPSDKIGNGSSSEKLEIRCGASFGIGIYSSPQAEYALHYAHMDFFGNEKTRTEELPGLRLIICAVLMGRPLQVTRDETRQTEGLADSKAHSHVSPNMLEYVVFEPSQIIPCYVVHLDLSAEEARKALSSAPSNPNN